MTEALLSYIPTYGLWLIFGSVALSCLALPIPSSMLVMAAGAFAASGDFAYWNLVLHAYAGFLVGDQMAFWLARGAGAPLIDRLGARPRFGKLILKAQSLLSRHGVLAVILTRTILGPLGPYVAYVSGALKTPWMRFSPASAGGAFLWCIGYSGLGYLFAGQLVYLADMISSSVGIVIAGTIAILTAISLIGSYRRASKKASRKQ